MRRRLMTFVVVTGLTAAASTWWLYEGDLGRAIRPLTEEDPPVLVPDAPETEEDAP